MNGKSDSKKRPAKKLRAVKTSGVLVSDGAVKVRKGRPTKAVRRDRYRSFSVTERENNSMPGLAKKAGYDDVAAWLRFVALGVVE